MGRASADAAMTRWRQKGVGPAPTAREWAIGLTLLALLVAAKWFVG